MCLGVNLYQQLPHVSQSLRRMLERLELLPGLTLINSCLMFTVSKFETVDIRYTVLNDCFSLCKSEIHTGIKLINT